jgi:hypothetical protein
MSQSSGEPSDYGDAWTVLQQAELSASSDELALLATWEAMRLMLINSDEARRRRGREGLRGLLEMMLTSLREHDPAGLDRLVEEWRPTAEAAGLEW